ncbi:hypothetical protein VDBG_06215 [Verticillium alfalfae VaMs.102]|uniref:Uncharacterized protein n=1 Tax=Verticillium alfalfae (strain VaMs.102 / ATCC MYA-4576 / FGSC 10136) TaxID=526221 RepID=C9SMU1_VERA1|nr:hypothetical protein VDBG_06215 [Verticillium alfalfae VaMs.102]EEY20106.1 hypothetical protein VDBG_06215 [Verticillium alfalfae VaMs.102]
MEPAGFKVEAEGKAHDGGFLVSQHKPTSQGRTTPRVNNSQTSEWSNGRMSLSAILLAEITTNQSQ